MAADPPMTSDMLSTSFSRWPKEGATSSPTTSTSGLQSPITTRSSPWRRLRGDNVDSGLFEPGRAIGRSADDGDEHVVTACSADTGEPAAAHPGLAAATTTLLAGRAISLRFSVSRHSWAADSF